MSDSSCDRASLVEASFDGRLGPAEQASIERHMKTCASCTELLRDLTAIRGSLRSTAPIPPLVHQRARIGLLRSAATPVANKQRPVALLVAAFVALPLVAWAGVSVVGSRTTAPSSATAIVPSAPAAPLVAPQPHEPAVLPAAPAVTPESAAPPPSPLVVPSPRAVVPPHATSTSAALPSAPHPSAHATIEAPATAPSASSASREFAEAMDAVARGDFAAGAGKLGAFAAAHPADPRAEEASYLQAVALERAGRSAEAKAAARRYLAMYPEGAHRAPARRLAGE